MTLPPKIQEEIEKLAAIQVLNRGTDTKDAQNHLQYVYDTYFQDAVSTALTHIATQAIKERDMELSHRIDGLADYQFGEKHFIAREDVVWLISQTKEQQKVRCEHDWQNVTTDEYGYMICKTCGEQTDLY